jgi:ankyrin repeat protein
MQVVEALLKWGVEVDSHDKNNRTPLHLSSEHGYLKAVRLLLDYGADANAQDKDNITPLHLASNNGRMQTVQLLLDRGADAKARDKYDRTPLDLASENRHLKIVQLLSNGADENRDCDDKTGGEFGRQGEACGQALERTRAGADCSDGAMITAAEPYEI